MGGKSLHPFWVRGVISDILAFCRWVKKTSLWGRGKADGAQHIRDSLRRSNDRAVVEMTRPHETKRSSTISNFTFTASFDIGNPTPPTGADQFLPNPARGQRTQFLIDSFFREPDVKLLRPSLPLRLFLAPQSVRENVGFSIRKVLRRSDREHIAIKSRFSLGAPLRMACARTAWVQSGNYLRHAVLLGRVFLTQLGCNNSPGSWVPPTGHCLVNECTANVVASRVGQSMSRQCLHLRQSQFVAVNNEYLRE